jgi:pantetheine-phosphate adenylyltransferase
LKAVYPGSFDPITNGHLDIIERASRVFGEVVVAVAPNSDKKRPLFTVQERVELIRESCRDFPNVKVDSFTGLTVDYVENQGASVIVRSLRATSDFEYEFQMALMNRRQKPSIETVFMMTGADFIYLSSSIVKEVAALGGSVEGLVPEPVREKLIEKLGRSQQEVR